LQIKWTVDSLKRIYKAESGLLTAGFMGFYNVAWNEKLCYKSNSI